MVRGDKSERNRGREREELNKEAIRDGIPILDNVINCA